MKRIALLTIAALVALSAAARAPQAVCPIDATKATLISDPNNQMTHYTTDRKSVV